MLSSSSCEFFSRDTVRPGNFSFFRGRNGQDDVVGRPGDTGNRGVHLLETSTDFCHSYPDRFSGHVDSSFFYVTTGGSKPTSPRPYYWDFGLSTRSHRSKRPYPVLGSRTVVVDDYES